MIDDLEDEVPLDREEEQARQDGTGQRERDPTADLLFRTLMSSLKPRPPISVEVGATVDEACTLMRDNKIGCVLVVDGEKLVGIFTERDVLYKLTGSDFSAKETKIEELMTPNPTTLRLKHTLAHALNKMSVDGCRHVPLTDRAGRPVGVVSVRRIVDFLVDEFAQELLTLPPDPDQAMPTAEGG